jgi:hypothetical protein
VYALSERAAEAATLRAWATHELAGQGQARPVLVCGDLNDTPEFDLRPEKRDWRLACAVMQMPWQEEADTRPVTQITPPPEVHEFISEQPGLFEACQSHLRYLITYAPQLTIRGFGGAFEDDIEALYANSIASDEGIGEANEDSQPSRRTTCAEDYALRAPDFGGHSPADIACGFIQGYYVVNGPPVQYYSQMEYVAWVLSDASLWVPADIREMLSRGMAEWGVWPWHEWPDRSAAELGFEPQTFTGKFAEAIERPRFRVNSKLNDEARRDLLHRLNFSISLLGLPEDAETLANRLMGPEFLGIYLSSRRRGRRR